MRTEKRVILEWEEIEEKSAISIYQGNGYNPLWLDEIWRELKREIISSIFEGDTIELIHNVTLSEVNPERIDEYWEIKIPQPCFSNWNPEKYIQWQNELLLKIINALHKLKFEVDLFGPSAQNKLSDAIKKILEES